MAEPTNKTSALGWIERKLGGGIVVIELSTDHLDDAFDDAIRWYVGHKGIKRHAVVNMIPGVQEYTMPDDTDEVIEVFFPGVQLDIIAAINPYAFIDVDQLPVAYSSVTGVPGGQFYGTLHQILSHAETARRIVGSEPAWEYYKDRNIVHLFPRSQRTGAIVARYASTKLGVHDEDDTENNPNGDKNDFAAMRFRERDLILKYAVAGVKERLGRVRSKYTDGMPSAGGSKNLDGETLLGEAQNEMEALTTTLLSLSNPVPMLVG